MEPELFYWIGGATALSALIVSAIGIRSENFPPSRGALFGVIGFFAFLVVGSTTYAVVNARDEESHRETEIAEEDAQGEEVEAADTGQTGSDIASTSQGEVDTITMSDFAFDPIPAEVKTGTDLTVDNDGPSPHNLTIRDGSEELAATDDIDEGESTDLEIDLDQGGYEMVCTIPGHEEAGMVGEFIVAE